MSNEDLRLKGQLCFRLYTASRLIVKSYTPLLSELGLTYPQYLVMMVMWETDGLTVNEIGGRLMLQTNTVTPLLKRMEQMGLVERRRGEGDKRRVIVALTERGRAMEKEARGIPQAQVIRMLCNGATEETIPGLLPRLDSVIEILRGMTGEKEAQE